MDMKNLLFLFLLLMVVSCTDEEMAGGGTGDSIQLNLVVPASTTVSTRAMSVEDESAIKDLYVLVFDSNEKCVLVKKTEVSNTDNASMKRTSLILDKSSDNKSIVALANLETNKVDNINSSVWEGQYKETILKSLVYNFDNPKTGDAGVTWNPFPMWGEFEGTINTSITINMLRALAKVNVIVNKNKDTEKGEGLDNFVLKKVLVYYSYKDGYCAPDKANVDGTGSETKVVKPSMHSQTQMGKEEGMEFVVPENERLEFKNNIYLPEANNRESGQKNVCLLIAGSYNGGEELSYYRAAFKNSEEGVLDILRNHLYEFNITSVEGPGSKDPEEALKKVDVNMNFEVTAWDEVKMTDPNTKQYTLAVDHSTVILAGQNLEGRVTVLEELTGTDWSAEGEISWFTVTKSGNKVLINTTENKGAKREGSFVIKTDQLSKQIKVIQTGIETANCYIVADGFGEETVRDLVVTVKGNGKDGLHADGKNGDYTFQYDPTANLNTDHVGIIWETVEGLVTLNTTTANSFGCIQYTVNKSKVGNGGNALIGAFDIDDNVIWSWHIWIVPDYKDYEGNFENLQLQKWITGYDFMDRNLGAISNKPGYGSLGLLYQWGRKDPLRGVGNINESEAAVVFMHTNPKKNVPFAWTQASSSDIATSILNPTQILPKGLLMTVDGYYLWGTNQGLVPSSVGITNVGNKTIYDPCPAGYRVPPVDAYVFGKVSMSGSTVSGDNSYRVNWNNNNIFWPNDNSYYDDADSYGFWVKFGSSNVQPVLSNYGGGWGETTTNPSSVNDATWLPIAGVYDGTFDEFATIGKNSSVKVNSIVWTNSPITTTTETRPAALFLHGREKTSSTSGLASNNGRHLHKLNETQYGLMAKTQYAGSVRCVRDKAKDFSSKNEVTTSITLGGKKGSSATGTLTTVNNRWEVVDPGAKWFYVTPEEGTGGISQELKFIASMDNTGDYHEATMKIRFYDENNVAITPDKEIVVGQNSSNMKFEADSYVLSLTRTDKSRHDIKIMTDGQDWDVYGDLPNWLTAEAISNKTKVRIRANSNNSTGTKRNTVVTLKDANGKTITINVTQSN